MEKTLIEKRLDLASKSALNARSRIEAAIDAGVLPVWVLEACEVWEQSALAYGSASAELKLSTALSLPVLSQLSASCRLH